MKQLRTAGAEDVAPALRQGEWGPRWTDPVRRRHRPDRDGPRVQWRLAFCAISGQFIEKRYLCSTAILLYTRYKFVVLSGVSLKRLKAPSGVCEHNEIPRGESRRTGLYFRWRWVHDNNY